MQIFSSERALEEKSRFWKMSKSKTENRPEVAELFKDTGIFYLKFEPLNCNIFPVRQIVHRNRRLPVFWGYFDAINRINLRFSTVGGQLLIKLR